MMAKPKVKLQPYKFGCPFFEVFLTLKALEGALGFVAFAQEQMHVRCSDLTFEPPLLLLPRCPPSFPVG